MTNGELFSSKQAGLPLFSVPRMASSGWVPSRLFLL